MRGIGSAHITCRVSKLKGGHLCDPTLDNSDIDHRGACSDREETAQVMQKSTRAVERDWQFAKAWLRRELARSGPPRAVTKEQPH